MKTNCPYPVALIKFGEVGYKLAWLEKVKVQNNTVKHYFGYAMKTPWRKAHNGTPVQYYKTRRVIEFNDIINLWKEYPSKGSIEKAIANYKKLIKTREG